MQAKIGVTDGGNTFVALYDGATLVAKMYHSPDKKRLRIILPEMRSEKQVLGELKSPVPYIEYRRES